MSKRSRGPRRWQFRPILAIGKFEILEASFVASSSGHVRTEVGICAKDWKYVKLGKHANG